MLHLSQYDVTYNFYHNILDSDTHYKYYMRSQVVLANYISLQNEIWFTFFTLLSFATATLRLRFIRKLFIINYLH